jgi:hypothetical protein
MTRTVWGYAMSDDESEWSGSCATREEAIVEAPAELGLEPGDEYFVIRGEYPDPSAFMPDAEDVIEIAHERLGDNFNVEGQELEVTGGTAELNEFLREWARRNLKATHWLSVAKAERHVYAPPAQESA